jgi:hypothetical protein
MRLKTAPPVKMVDVGVAGEVETANVDATVVIELGMLEVYVFQVEVVIVVLFPPLDADHVATGGIEVITLGCEVTTAGMEVQTDGMPVMTPSELVMVVYEVKGLSYEEVTQDNIDFGPVGSLVWPSEMWVMGSTVTVCERVVAANIAVKIDGRILEEICVAVLLEYSCEC